MIVLYEFTILKEDFSIRRIISVHYFEYEKNYAYTGESHDFYELVYVDKGEAVVIDGEKIRTLKCGECIIHMPGIWHNIKSDGKTAPNLIIISFECKSPHMEFAKNQIFHLSAADKEHLAVIIRETSISFKSPLNDPNTKKLVRNTHIIGSEQLIKISLESIVINLYRGMGNSKPDSVFKEHLENDIVYSVKNYLNENVHEKLKFADIVNFAKTSPTSIKCAFKKCEGTGVMSYFASLKIERAKQYIREDNYNFTQISQLLSYDTPHRFTKQFKAKTGMTPTEYANSVKINILNADNKDII